MKIIDWDAKGNVVRFYLGKDDLADWWGDDWNDAPYDCNAGAVYEEYISGYKDIAFPFDFEVLEPADDYFSNYNCSYSKEDMMKRLVPCIIAGKLPVDNFWHFDGHFSRCLGLEGMQKFYMGDSMEPDVEVEYDEDLCRLVNKVTGEEVVI